MLGARLQFEKVNYIDETDLEIGEFPMQKYGRGQCFLSRDIPCRSEYQIRFAVLIIACPIPDSKPFGAMFDCRLHVHILQVELLVADDDIDIVFAAQTMVGY